MTILYDGISTPYYRSDCQKIFSWLAHPGAWRGRGEQMDTLWAYMKKRVANTTRYMSPSNRAAMIELMMQTRNDNMISNSALQLYMMARWTLAALHLSRLDVSRLATIVSWWPINEVSEHPCEVVDSHTSFSRHY